MAKIFVYLSTDCPALLQASGNKNYEEMQENVNCVSFSNAAV
jgi:hypothetical protein